MTPDDLLPAPLRCSRLPWHPLHDDQAPAPRPLDGWRAYVGPLGFLLDVERGPSFALYLFRERPRGRWNRLHQWEFDDLRAASTVADAVLELLTHADL